MRTMATKILFQKKMLIFWWFLGIFTITTFTMYFFPVFKNGTLSSSIASLPLSLQKLLGDRASWTTVGGYISQQIFALRAPLEISVLSIFIFNSLTTGDERKGLLETQLSLTNGRTRILINKLIAGIFIVGIVTSAVLAGVILGDILIHYHYSYIKTLIITTNCLLLVLDFGLVAFLVGCMTGRNGVAVGIASIYAFGSYLVSSMAGTVSSLKFIDNFSLFHYYQNLATFDLGNLIVMCGFGLFCVVMGMLFFSLRDIRTSS